MELLNTILVGFLLFVLWMTGIPQYGWAWAKYLFKRYWPGSRRRTKYTGTTVTSSNWEAGIDEERFIYGRPKPRPKQPDTDQPLGGGWTRRKVSPELTDEQARKAIDKLFEGYVDPLAVKRELMRKKLEDD